MWDVGVQGLGGREQRLGKGSPSEVPPQSPNLHHEEGDVVAPTVVSRETGRRDSGDRGEVGLCPQGREGIVPLDALTTAVPRRERPLQPGSGRIDLACSAIPVGDAIGHAVRRHRQTQLVGPSPRDQGFRRPAECHAGLGEPEPQGRVVRRDLGEARPQCLRLLEPTLGLRGLRVQQREVVVRG